jgi:carboxyl-terminal processing protease
MFDKYRGSLAQIDNFGKLDSYLDQIDLAGQFISYAERVDGIKLKPGEWEDSKIYMMPQLKALVGRFSKLDDEAFYRFYIPIDDTIKAAMENPATVD